MDTPAVAVAAGEPLVARPSIAVAGAAHGACRRPFRTVRLVLVGAAIALIIYLVMVSPIIVIDYPTDGGRIATTPDCIAEVTGRVTGFRLPGAVLWWAVVTNEGYPQSPGVISPDGSFQLQGYFGGQNGDYPHGIRVELVELGFWKRATATVSNVARGNPCTIR